MHKRVAQPAGACHPTPVAPRRAVDMFCTCAEIFRMPKMIQIRNVPDELHRRLTSRAAQARMSLSGYLLTEIRKIAEMPTWEEFSARLSTRPPITPSESPAEIIRRVRDQK